MSCRRYRWSLHNAVVAKSPVLLPLMIIRYWVLNYWSNKLPRCPWHSWRLMLCDNYQRLNNSHLCIPHGMSIHILRGFVQLPPWLYSVGRYSRKAFLTILDQTWWQTQHQSLHWILLHWFFFFLAQMPFHMTQSRWHISNVLKHPPPAGIVSTWWGGGPTGSGYNQLTGHERHLRRIWISKENQRLHQNVFYLCWIVSAITFNQSIVTSWHICPSSMLNLDMHTDALS